MEGGIEGGRGINGGNNFVEGNLAKNNSSHCSPESSNYMKPDMQPHNPRPTYCPNYQHNNYHHFPPPNITAMTQNNNMPPDLSPPFSHFPPLNVSFPPPPEHYPSPAHQNRGPINKEGQYNPGQTTGGNWDKAGEEGDNKWPKRGKRGRAPPGFSKSAKGDGDSKQTDAGIRLHNDYNQHFVDTGERPGNFIRDAEENVRFSEYPRLDRLMRAKKELSDMRAVPSQHMRVDLRTFPLSELGIKFDVVYIDPPWEEYRARIGGCFHHNENLTPWTLESIRQLQIDRITETPSFCFLWCGVTHLEHGRELLSHWGFRRCEDICWIKKNRKNLDTALKDENSILQRTKEHCLMGIKGTVRRGCDGHLIHTNLDVDVIVEEGVANGSTAKPSEMYGLIDRFCLGRRKLELFASDRNIRPGWVSLGDAISVDNFDINSYTSWTSEPIPTSQLLAPNLFPNSLPNISYHQGRYTGSTPEIEALRPKSPPRNASKNEPDLPEINLGK